MNKIMKYLKKMRLTLLFAIIFFLILLATLSLVFVGMFFLTQLNIVDSMEVEKVPLVMFAAASLIVGTVLAAIFSKRPLSPLRDIMNATDRIADGDYEARLHLNKPEEFRQLSDKFNHMAKELGSIEMLRTDFVNNFSHEFKTPIVSIRGFAKALKWNDLSPEESNEYLDIIISESERLADLATNILNLSKIEQQSILTEKKQYNVAEQIRLVIALLETKWTEKKLDIYFECDELLQYGNEELLKQVWINLLDNAIKFSPDFGTITILIKQTEHLTVFCFTNQGQPIPKEKADHIFDKFYQGDLSHTTKGNGLGLTLVKKIIDLHGGHVYLKESNSLETTMEVQLPNTLE